MLPINENPFPELTQLKVIQQQTACQIQMVRTLVIYPKRTSYQNPDTKCPTNCSKQIVTCNNVKKQQPSSMENKYFCKRLIVHTHNNHHLFKILT